MSISVLPPYMALQLSFPHTKPSLQCPFPASQSPSPSPHGESLVQQCQSFSNGSHFLMSMMLHGSLVNSKML